MGQQRAASGTWRSHNKPTSRDSYETMGQQTCPSNMSHPAIEPDRVKKSKSRFEAERKIPSESEGKSSDFARYGMVVKKSQYAHRPSGSHNARAERAFTYNAASTSSSVT